MADPSGEAWKLLGKGRGGCAGDFRPCGIHAAKGADFLQGHLAIRKIQPGEIAAGRFAGVLGKEQQRRIERPANVDAGAGRAEPAHKHAINVAVKLPFTRRGTHREDDAMPGIGADGAAIVAADADAAARGVADIEFRVIGISGVRLIEGAPLSIGCRRVKNIEDEGEIRNLAEVAVNAIGRGGVGELVALAIRARGKTHHRFVPAGRRRDAKLRSRPEGRQRVAPARKVGIPRLDDGWARGGGQTIRGIGESKRTLSRANKSTRGEKREQGEAEGAQHDRESGGLKSTPPATGGEAREHGQQ
jgi:hypothetical protein